MTERPRPKRPASKSRLVAAAVALSAGLALVGGMKVAAGQASEATTAPAIRRVVVLPDIDPIVVMVPSEAAPSTTALAPATPEPPPAPVRPVPAPVTESSGS